MTADNCQFCVGSDGSCLVYKEIDKNGPKLADVQCDFEPKVDGNGCNTKHLGILFEVATTDTARAGK
jgi:hypothetical protein